MSVRLNIIAAVADNLAIGNGGRLLWHIAEDLRYFKKVTMGCPVIMGRRTFESIGRPLPGRKNIVLTRGEGTFPPGVIAAPSLDRALSLAAEEPGLADGRADVFVIGGGEVYAQALPLAERLYITQVHARAAADTFFPAIDTRLWRVAERGQRKHDPDSGLDYEFIVYERNSVK